MFYDKTEENQVGVDLITRDDAHQLGMGRDFGRLSGDAANLEPGSGARSIAKQGRMKGKSMKNNQQQSGCNSCEQVCSIF